MLDGGAYCGEGGFFAQMAAMHAIGPYKIENVDIDSYLVYTNNQPSSSIRAPTAPQACWAVEQHMDEVAAAIGMDAVELRRRTLIEEGKPGATGQVYDAIGMRETLEKAAEMIGWGQDLPEDEAIGIACGWWPSFGVPSGAYVKLNGDGSGVIITGAMESGTGAVMGLPLLAAEVLGMQPGGLLDPLPGHRRGPVGHGLVRLADDVQQRPRRHRRRHRGARAAARRRRRAARGGPRPTSSWPRASIRVKGSPDRSVAIADLAGSGKPLPRQGLGRRARGRRRPTSPRTASAISASRPSSPRS